MRQLFVSILIFTIIVGCQKSPNEPDQILVDLAIVSVVTPTNINQGQDIISNIKCSVSNLCYKFAKLEIKEIADKQFEIKAKATFPNSKKGDIVCLEAMYFADTSLKINAITEGQYVLNFYNNNLLFQSDTVLVK